MHIRQSNEGDQAQDSRHLCTIIVWLKEKLKISDGSTNPDNQTASQAH
jgi:hypothetical protein